ncbi:MAG: MarR family winged helix-turn-helix transcriptional regulator [Sphingopyxis sp.]|uniref:MarR family winged helix-turn-helix transcriptional regulator n=1 Tax=Sphingopyxis sp. TaxID=1908224 RepID=UPI002AB944B5|nr:MarR family winged helix-turn-helix transcriptional regulator [Sphingopyxis sp.]MDZ3831866.1 MarR family winged helix-turn-helix transcriptional regulator [Sphingopyxis sp.]
MQQFSNQEMAELKSRIDQIHELLASREGDASPGKTVVAPVPERDAVMMDQLAFSIRMRRVRRMHFGGALLTGPIWDMMLDLTLAGSNGRELSASDLATGAGVPLSSGLRMIASLEELGLAKRAIDVRDRRRSIVSLTEYGAERMASYFERIGSEREKSALFVA